MFVIKKQVCIATYVFGDDYQEYIPFYIYSILKNYPNYDVRIYLDRTLNNRIRKSLDKLKLLGDFSIIENYANELSLTENAKNNDMISRSMRWLFYDDAFVNYKYLYIGDIDIFICKEKPDLCDQHIEHSQYLSLPYSNCVRKEKELYKKNPKIILKYFLRYGIRETFRYLFKKINFGEKLTGLHFIDVDEYFFKTKPLFEKYISELNDVSNSKSKRWTLCDINDEVILYELIKESGIGLPKIAEGPTNSAVINKNPQSVGYRPHHGLHLGIWRTNINNIKGSDLEDVLLSDLYLEYYRQFCQLRESDMVLKEMISNASGQLRNVINNMDTYYREIS